MKICKTTLAFLALVALVVGPAGAAQNHQLLPQTAGDFAVDAVSSSSSAKARLPIENDAVSFTWPLSGDETIAERPSAHTASSREYHLRVSAADLVAGVAIPLSASGALIRLNPAASDQAQKAISLDPSDLELTDAAKRIWTDGSGMINLADAEAVKAAGAPFAEGTSAFRIDPELGNGVFTLRAPRLEKSPAPYVVHVFEKSSLAALEVRTDRRTYVEGSEFTATFSFSGIAGIRVDRLEGALHTPRGETIPVSLKRSGQDSFVASARIESALDAADGLWEIHATAVATAKGTQVRRDVHTAFAVAAPTARLLGRVVVDHENGLHFTFPIEVGDSGRYEVRGILFGTDGSGELRPIAISHSADVAAVGVTQLTLAFASDLIEESGLNAPFELRDLQLSDQGRMSGLHRQARALALH